MEKSFSVLAFFILLRDLIFLEVFFQGLVYKDNGTQILRPRKNILHTKEQGEGL